MVIRTEKTVSLLECNAARYDMRITSYDSIIFSKPRTIKNTPNAAEIAAEIVLREIWYLEHRCPDPHSNDSIVELWNKNAVEMIAIRTPNITKNIPHLGKSLCLLAIYNLSFLHNINVAITLQQQILLFITSLSWECHHLS
jgi:hypothetical protein